MNEFREYIPLLSALLGALIGAAASIATIVVQSHYQNKRELVQQATSLALEDWKIRIELAKENGGAILPLSVFVSYHAKLIGLAERNKISPETLKILTQEQDALLRVLADMRKDTSK